MQTKPANGSNGREIVAPAQSQTIPVGQNGLKLPSLEEMLAPKYKDGKLIWEPVTIKIQPMGTYFRCTIHMPTLHQELCLLVMSLKTAAEEIEAQVSSGKVVPMPDWESREKARQTRSR